MCIICIYCDVSYTVYPVNIHWNRAALFWALLLNCPIGLTLCDGFTALSQRGKMDS